MDSVDAAAVRHKTNVVTVVAVSVDLSGDVAALVSDLDGQLTRPGARRFDWLQ